MPVNIIQPIVTTKKNWWIIPAVALVGIIAVVILLITIFKPKKDQQQERIIELQNQLIESLQRVNEKSDSIILYQKEVLKGNREKETTIIREYREIPAKVKNLSKEQLRNEVNNYE
jgi:preprotein translocase subunit SecF